MEPCIRWGPEWAILRAGGEMALHCKVNGLSAVSCATRAQQLLRWVTVPEQRAEKLGAAVPLSMGSWVAI